MKRWTPSAAIFVALIAGGPSAWSQANLALAEAPADQVDKISECAREIGRQYVVAIGGALGEPLFEGVGNPGWGAADNPVAARRGGKVVEVAQGKNRPL